jgi:hypothetical protein
MSLENPELRPASGPAEAKPLEAAAITPSVSGPAPGALWGWAVALGLLAGVIAWTGEEVSRRFVNPEPLSGEPFPGPATARLLAGARLRSGLIAFGLQGALLGLALGVAGGLARRSRPAAVTAGLSGMVVGGLAGAGASLFFVPIFHRRFDPMNDDLVMPLLVHSGQWGAVGAAAGLAFGMGLGSGARSVRTLVGGLLGAVCAAMLYDLIASFAFPMEKTAFPLAGSLRTRFIARVCVALFVAAGAALVARDAKRN